MGEMMIARDVCSEGFPRPYLALGHGIVCLNISEWPFATKNKGLHYST